METLLSIQFKMFYVNYHGAIRQAKFDSAVCWPCTICGGGDVSIKLKWKVAGINEPKEHYQVDYKVYYSVEDAEDEKNEIKIETLAWQTVNKYSDNFFIRRDGYPFAYVWNGAKPVEKNLLYELENVRSELHGNKFVLVSDTPIERVRIKLRSTLDELGPIYKTAEECKSHYRPKIVTF